METATRKPRVNVNLPEDVHERLKRIAESTHRTIVGVVDWLSTDAERELTKQEQPVASEAAAT